MIYEIIATVRVARDEHGNYLATIDFGDGSAPEALHGHSTLTNLMERTAREIAAALRESDPP